MKRKIFFSLLLLFVCFTILHAQTTKNSVSNISQKDWVYIGIGSEFAVYYDGLLVASFPEVFLELKLLPITAKIRNQYTPAKLQPKTEFFVVHSTVNCDKQSVKYDRLEFYSKAGQLIGKTNTPQKNLSSNDARLISKFCQKSKVDMSDSGRWKWIAIKEKGFDEYVIFYDSESIVQQYSTVNFWWKLQPLYPLHYADNKFLFSSLYSTQDAFGFILNNAVLNCSSRQIRTKSVIYYSKDSNVLEKKELNGNFADIIPESMGELFYKNLCK